MKNIILIASLLSMNFAYATSNHLMPLDEWVKFEEKVSLERLLENISPEGTVAGVVIASPSRDNPNYFFHWTRDAALVMDGIVNLYANAEASTRPMYLKYIEDFISLSRRQQLTPSAEGLGEPRYTVDGLADTILWSRPQYDGPALRAITLIRFLKVLPSNETQLKARTLEVIRTDLEFVMLKWNVICYDLWEELIGHHFYTQATQYSALMSGASFFKTEDDFIFSEQLGQSGLSMLPELKKYIVQKNNTIGASRNLVLPPGSTYKSSNLDTAVIMAILHGSDHGYLLLNDELVINTAEALENIFSLTYKINEGAKGPAMGRFFDDIYFGGNPWYLTTAAFAELYYRIGNLQKGDEFLMTIQKYTGSQGEMSEQINRETGAALSAHDLTWSYAAFLSAANARAQLLLSIQ